MIEIPSLFGAASFDWGTMLYVLFSAVASFFGARQGGKKE
jgi:hypothetical protein